MFAFGSYIPDTYVHAASFSVNKRRFSGSLIYGDRYFINGQIYPLFFTIHTVFSWIIIVVGLD